MSLILLFLLVFGGGLVMSGIGGIIYYKEDVKPIIEEIEEVEIHDALKKEIIDELNQLE